MEKPVVAAGEKTNLDGFTRARAFPSSSEVAPGEKGPSASLSNLQPVPSIETRKYLAYIRNHPVASWGNIPKTVKREVLPGFN